MFEGGGIGFHHPYINLVPSLVRFLDLGGDGAFDDFFEGGIFLFVKGEPRLKLGGDFQIFRSFALDEVAEFCVKLEMSVISQVVSVDFVNLHCFSPILGLKYLPAVCRKGLESSDMPLRVAGRVWNIPRGSCGLQGGFGKFREVPAGCRKGLEYSERLLRVAGRVWNILIVLSKPP